MQIRKVPIQNKKRIFEVLREADILFVNNISYIPIFTTDCKIKLNDNYTIDINDLDCVLVTDDIDVEQPTLLYLKDGKSVRAMRYANLVFTDF